MEGDDRTFGADFSSEGIVKLRERVEDKLKEFMGAYTDEALVEYVIVLLKNGRRKDEFKSELNVFLGNDSDSFITWLWDYLESNLSLYVQSLEPLQVEVSNTRSGLNEPPGRTESHHIESEVEKENVKKSSSNRRRREWKGLVRDENENGAPVPQISTADEKMSGMILIGELIVQNQQFLCGLQFRRKESNPRSGSLGSEKFLKQLFLHH